MTAKQNAQAMTAQCFGAFTCDYCVQNWHFMGNVKPVLEDGSPLQGAAGCQVAEMHIVAGSTQSNCFDCGCHTIMSLRAIAAVVLDGQPWFDISLKLPAESDPLQDAAWRQQIADECLIGSIDVLI